MHVMRTKVHGNIYTNRVTNFTICTRARRKRKKYVLRNNGVVISRQTSYIPTRASVPFPPTPYTRTATVGHVDFVVSVLRALPVRGIHVRVARPVLQIIPVNRPRKSRIWTGTTYGFLRPTLSQYVTAIGSRSIRSSYFSNTFTALDRNGPSIRSRFPTFSRCGRISFGLVRLPERTYIHYPHRCV